MNWKNKVFIITSIVILTSFYFIYANILPYSGKIYALVMISFSLLICSFYYLILDRIKRLKQEVDRVATSKLLAQHIRMNGNDALADIAAKFNKILNENKAESIKITQQLEEYKAELEKTNSYLSEDILEEKDKNNITDEPNKMTLISEYNAVTSLPNRIFFNEILLKSMKHAIRHNQISVLLIINLDTFQKINTSLGKKIGDRVLKEISVRFSNTLRSEDILSHLNGDEFAVLLNNIGKAKFASTVAEKLLSACKNKFNIDNHEFFITASIGVGAFPHDGRTTEELIKNTNIALYKAKQAGGNAYRFYTHEMDVEAHKHVELDRALRSAIDNNEFILHYQPKLHIKRGNIIGVESLLRWTHPEFGPINPEKFIALSEETGYYMKIAEWTIQEACRINKYWQNEGYEHITVGVNLSLKQFYHNDIGALIEKYLKESDLNPKYLELEINEKTIMENITHSTKILEDLKSIGVQLTVDHFGSGYTSISHLKQLPINTLKIDQNFIKGIPYFPNDLAITNAFIGLAHNLNFEVVAEGVELAEQVEYLSEKDCDIVQGYFLSHPLPADKVVLQFKKLSEKVWA